MTFPQAIDFKISVHDSQGSLTQATIHLTYKGFGYQEAHQVKTTTPVATYTFQWHDDLTINNDHFTPAGTQIKYYWTITDNAGNNYTDPPQTVEIVDNRFQWKHVSQEHYRVNWYDRGTDFGQMVLRNVDTSINKISRNLGGGPRRQINLWIYKNRKDFQSSLPPNAHEWVGGVAFPGLSQASIAVESSEDETLQRDMLHELTHLVLHQLVAPGIAPTWFDEGLAVYNQNFHESGMALQFKTALKRHNLLRLNTIAEDFPSDADKAYLAYAQSWKLVEYMYQTFGLQKMATLIKNMDNPDQGFDTDMRQALGLDVAHLENQWLLSLNQPPTLSKDQMPEPLPAPQQPFNAYNGTTIALLLVGVVFVVVALVGLGGIMTYQRRERQKILLAQQAQYTPQSIIPSQSGPQSHFLHTPYAHPSNYTSPSAYTPPGQPPVAGQHLQQPFYSQYPSHPPNQIAPGAALRHPPVPKRPQE